MRILPIKLTCPTCPLCTLHVAALAGDRKFDMRKDCFYIATLTARGSNKALKTNRMFRHPYPSLFIPHGAFQGNCYGTRKSVSSEELLSVHPRNFIESQTSPNVIEPPLVYHRNVHRTGNSMHLQHVQRLQQWGHELDLKNISGQDLITLLIQNGATCSSASTL